MKTVGIVLAGGLSRRFGSPKAFAKIGDESFYRRAVDALTPYCKTVVIVTRPELIDHYPAGLEIITDLPEYAGFGPLAGILSVMEFVEADRYVVLPCDMPYVNEYVIGSLIKSYEKDVTAIIANERNHPLVSIWSRETKVFLRKALAEQQLSVMELLGKLDTVWVTGNSLTGDEGFVFQNVNTPIDLEGS